MYPLPGGSLELGDTLEVLLGKYIPFVQSKLVDFVYLCEGSELNNWYFDYRRKNIHSHEAHSNRF